MGQKRRAQKLYHFIQDVASNPRLRGMIQFSFDVFKETEPFLKHPCAWNAARVVIGVAKAFYDEYQIYPDTFFEDGEWKPSYPYFFSTIVIDALSGGPEPRVIKTAVQTNVVKIHELPDGDKIGYVFQTADGRPCSALYYSGDEARIRTHVTHKLWERLSTKAVLYRSATAISSENKHGTASPSFVPDVSCEALDSPRAREYAAYLTRCFDAGINRSVMLYGPPGTGKSTMARAIVKHLNYRSLRIRVEDIAQLDNSEVCDVFTILNPDVIILDDFDRTSQQITLLEQLEHFTRNVKLVIATVNDRNRLDEAILRPGRFDELVLVDKMEENVVRHILGAECQDAFETVRDWPIAFILELVKRRKIFSKEEANDTMVELINRVARLRREKNKHNIDDVDENFIEKMTGKKSEDRGDRSSEGTQMWEEGEDDCDDDRPLA